MEPKGWRAKSQTKARKSEAKAEQQVTELEGGDGLRWSDGLGSSRWRIDTPGRSWRPGSPRWIQDARCRQLIMNERAKWSI